VHILLLDYLDESTLCHVLGSNVVYRPDLRHKGQGMLERELKENDIDAIVTTTTLPPDFTAAWAASRSRYSYVAYVVTGMLAEEIEPAASISGKLHTFRAMAREPALAYISAFRQLERACAQEWLDPKKPPLRGRSRSDDVLLVGGGLVNLITAERLLRDGYQVKIADAGPNPKEPAPWTDFGCSRGGDDARMFTLSEMDNYNSREVHQCMNHAFAKSISDSGWAVHHKGTLSADEWAWIAEFESIPTWLADTYNDDIFSFNRESYELWSEWRLRDPDLFSGSVVREGILRVYSDARQWNSAIDRQRRIGATTSILSSLDVAAEQPALRSAVERGHIAGGINVVGFTVNAHKFMALLIDRLERKGVEVQWGQRARSIVFDAQKRVAGVRFDAGVVTTKNIVISPGAYAGDLLNGTRSEGRIHGVIGVWLQLPNIHPCLNKSLKLARSGHVTEDANITIATDRHGKPVIILGSGYGYTGKDPGNIDQRLLQVLYEGLLDTARKYFPEPFQYAYDRGELQNSLKYCVRPWTASSLGLFESMPTATAGSCVITGGHNTGGFAQAPSVAIAVSAALSGKAHPMHVLYHPDRLTTYLQRGMQYGHLAAPLENAMAAA
jgi:D-amino-acid dehydrogenase